MKVAKLDDRWAVGLLLVATAFFRLTQNMAATTFSLLGRDELHVSASEIGAIGAIIGLGVAGVTIGVSGRIAPRRAADSAAVGMGLLFASLLTFGLASSLPALLMAGLLIAVAGGVTMPGLVNALQAGPQSNRDRIIGLYTVSLSISLAGGPLLETLVLSVSHQDVRTPYMAFLVFPFLGLIALGAPRRHARRSQNVTVPTSNLFADAPQATPRSSGGRGSHPPGGRRWQGALLGVREGRLALIIQLLYAIPFAGITAFGALLDRIGFGVSSAQAQLAFTAFFAASFAARVQMAWRAPIIHKEMLLWVSAGLTTAGLLLLGIGHGLGLLLIAMAILGVPHGLTYPLALVLVADSVDPAALPRANAALLASTSLSTLVIPLVLGVIITAAGYRAMPLLMLIPVGVCTALLFGQRTRTHRFP